MAKYQSPGILLPTAYSSEEVFDKELQRRNVKAGFTIIGDAVLAHFGVKGMHWGERKEELKSQLGDYKTKKLQKIGHRAVREAETTAALIGLSALGVAYIRSPKAQAVMGVPTKAAARYLSKPDNRRKVGRFLKRSYIVYTKIN